MDETREDRLATILVRGMIRVRQRAARAGQRKMAGEETPPAVTDVSAGDQPAADQSVTAQSKENSNEQDD